MSGQKPELNMGTLRKELARRMTHTAMDLPGIRRIEIPVDTIDIRSLVGMGTAGWSMYWCNRDASVEMLGIGCAAGIHASGAADLMDTTSHARRMLDGSDTGVRLMGGASFDPYLPPAGEWAAFGTVSFTVPLFELRREHGEYLFAVNIDSAGYHEESAEIILDAFDHLKFGASPRIATASASPCHLTAILPAPSQWQTNVADLTRTFDDTFRKAVLACRFSITGDYNPSALFDHIAALNPGAYHYLLKNGPDRFLGASPEPLYARSGSSVTTEAIAGTAWGDMGRLLASAKDSAEHGWVVTDIMEELRGLCDQVAPAEERESFKLGALRHIRQRFSGTLRSGYGDPQILAALHPTAALLGYPRDRARQALALMEPFSRGWYGGPVGWLGRDDAEFCVAIRCALCRDDAVHLYAGAGIVQNSEPQVEWREIENKVRQYLDYFHVTI